MQPLLTQTILDDIVNNKRKEVARKKRDVPLANLKVGVAQCVPPRDFHAALQAPGVSLIAEVKRASPSKGVLRQGLDPVQCAVVYQSYGASAISVLTDQRYFQGSLVDLQSIHQAVSVPLLRKDFVFDPYQVYESRAAGADAVLLITAILQDEVMESLYGLIQELGMAALVEVHNEEEMQRALKLSPRIIGINNRNLRTFEVNLDTTADLIAMLPDKVVKVSESGIHTAPDVERVKGLGVDAILVGESIVTAGDMGAKVRELCLIS